MNAHRIVERLLEAEAEEVPPPDPEDTRAEVDRLLPTKSVRLRGSSMIHAPGLIDFAQRRWRERGKKAKQNAMDIIKAWQGLPDDLYLAILNGQCHVETDGDDAVVTIRQY